MSDLTRPRTMAAGPSGAAGNERRKSNRHNFTASAEVIEMVSGARFSTRTTDLGHGGCFVDTMVPFPEGAKVHIKVHQGEKILETDGIVVYSQYGLGMGVAFDPLDPTRREALDRWIAELTGERLAEQHDVMRALDGARKISREEHTAMARLVQLLISKRILTEAEGASVLHDLVIM